jgi:hypothetical protein
MTSSHALHRSARVWIVGTGLALVLIVAGLLVANGVVQRRMVREIESDQAALATQGRLVTWAISSHEAALVEEVVRLARSADLKEAIELGGRERLLDQLEPPLNRLRKGPLALTRLTLYAPDARLLMHAHDADGGDVPAVEERGLVRVAMDERRIVKGLGVIAGVPQVLAVSPIYHEGKIIGLLEGGSSLAPITRTLRSVTGAQVALRLGDGRVVDAAAPELFADALRSAGPRREPSRHLVRDDRRAVVVTLLPLTALGDHVVAHVALLFDVSPTMALVETGHTVTLVIAFVGCAVAGALLILLSRRLDGVYARLGQLHRTADDMRQRAEARAAGLAAVAVMTRSIASARTPGEAAEAVATAASSVLGAALTRIWIEAEPDMLRPAFAWGSAADTASPEVDAIPAGSGLTGRVFVTRAADYRPDVQEDPDCLNPLSVREAGLRAWAGIPLLSQDRIHGVASFLFTERREFTAEERELMRLLADSVTIAVERARTVLPVG